MRGATCPATDCWRCGAAGAPAAQHPLELKTDIVVTNVRFGGPVEEQSFSDEFIADCGIEPLDYLSLLAAVIANEGADEEFHAALDALGRDRDGSVSAVELSHAEASMDVRLQDALSLVDDVAVNDPAFSRLRPAAGVCREWVEWARGEGA